MTEAELSPLLSTAPSEKKSEKKEKKEKTEKKEKKRSRNEMEEEEEEVEDKAMEQAKFNGVEESKKEKSKVKSEHVCTQHIHLIVRMERRRNERLPRQRK